MGPRTMSETADSFEKIEFEQSALGESSTSDQESSELTNSDQHSASESSATTMNSSTDPEKTPQLKDVEFELGWKTRDEIVGNLSLHTTLLSGLIINADTREKMQKVNNDLVTTLMNLPLKVDGRTRSFESLGGSPDDGPNEVLLDLSSETRSKIVDTLMINHSLVLLNVESVSSKRKSELIDGNNCLIWELVKLRSRTVAIPGDSSASKGDHLNDQTAKANESQTTSEASATDKEKRLGELNNSKGSDRRVDATSQQQKPVEQPAAGPTASSSMAEEVLEKLKVQIAEELGKQISDQAEAIGSLEKNVRDGLKSELDKSKGVIFEIEGVKALLVGDSGKGRRSQVFHFRGLPWFLNVFLCVHEGKKHLAVFLHCKPTIDLDRCDIVTFELRILSSNPAGDMIRIGKDRELKSLVTGRGWLNFITVDELREGSFIQNDTIKIRAYLTTETFERITHSPRA